MRLSYALLVMAIAMLAAISLFTPAHAYVPQYCPVEIAVDAGGNVFAIMGTGSATGEGIFAFAANGTGIKAFRMQMYSDVAIDSDGIVYAVNVARKQVERLEKNGSFSVVWREGDPERFINYFAIDQDDNLLVSDFNYSQADIEITEGRILKISPEGQVIGVIEGSPVPSDKVFRLSASDNGTIYLTDFGGSSFSAIYPDGSHGTITPGGPGNNPFGEIVTVEAGDDGYIYAGDMSNGIVMKLTTDGTLAMKWDGCGPDRFISPASIVADRKGRVYVSDMQNQRIVWFDGNRYRFGENRDENLAGKGVLWDYIIAGDNYTISRQIIDKEMGGRKGMPGFGAAAALIGIGLAVAIICSRRLCHK